MFFFHLFRSFEVNSAKDCDHGDLLRLAAREARPVTSC